MKDKEAKPLVYVPANAKLNIGSGPMESIKTEYDVRLAVFDREKVKEIVKGIYGSSGESTQSNH